MSQRNKTKKRSLSKSLEPEKRKIRYAVVGLGYIAQIAVLPAFASAKNSELAALVPNNRVKLEKLSRKYNVPRSYSYEDYDACL